MQRTIGGPVVFGAVGSALGVASVFWIVAAILAGGVALAHTWQGRSA